MTFSQVQAQSFALAGAGAIAGATTITLKTFAQINGTLLVMANFGAKGYLTLEPGNSTFEEQVSFTGVTQNTNGTATLTGIKNVTMITPYTETSGLAITHAGSSTVILSNTSGYYTQFGRLANAETVTGLWTFPNDASTPLLGTSYVAPTLNNQVASKGYADSLTFAGAPDATTTQKGIVELATQAEVDAKTATGGTGASLVPTPALARSTLLSDYVIDTGAVNAYVITPSPAISGLTTGQRFLWKVGAGHTNTSASTLAVNGFAVTPIKKLNGTTALNANDLIAGQIVEVEYDGTNFQMLTPTANSVNFTGAGLYPGGDGSLITNLTKYNQKIDLVTTPVVVSGTTGETTIYTKSVAGNLLSTSNALRLRCMVNTFEANTAQTATFRIKYGGSAVITLVALTVTGISSGYIEVDLFATGATNSQYITACIVAVQNGDGATGTSGVSGTATTAIDSTASQTLAISVQFSASSAHNTITLQNAILELIQ